MTAGRRAGSGIGLEGGTGENAGSNASPRKAVRRLLACCPALLLLCGSPVSAASNKVRITNLSDVAFGTLANLSADSVQSQSLCLYADTATGGYNVRASGSGSGGAFTLSSGSDILPFEVQWSSISGQSSGTQLTANVALSGQVSGATQQTCNTGPASSASLILVIRSSALSSAGAGSYNGSLTLLIGPE